MFVFSQEQKKTSRKVFILFGKQMNELNIMWSYVIHLLNIPDNFRYILRFVDGYVWLILVPQRIHLNLPIHNSLIDIPRALIHFTFRNAINFPFIYTIEIWLIQMCGAHFPLFVLVTPVKLFQTGLRDCLGFFFWGFSSFRFEARLKELYMCVCVFGSPQLFSFYTWSARITCSHCPINTTSLNHIHGELTKQPTESLL